MILNKFGEEFLYDGITYRIGNSIIGTDESEYEGLKGVILEIRDGDDKDTENETPDIYCSFEYPVIPEDIEKLEKVFSDLYGEEMSLNDICLDEVIMSPSMIMIDRYTIDISV